MTDNTILSADERLLMRQSIQHLVAGTSGAEVPPRLRQLGWFDLYESDPELAVASVFDAQGSFLRTSPMLAVLMRHVLSHQPAGGIEDEFPPLVILPKPGQSGRPPGVQARGELVVDGMLTWPLPAGPLWLAAADGERLIVTATDPGALDVEPCEGLDYDLGLARVYGRVAADRTHRDDVSESWANAVTAGRLALAHEIVAAARGAMELARTHALERIQFGRPIGTFQAVKHHLADATVALEVAEEALAQAWRAYGPETVRLAKVLAGRAADEVGRHAQQILGGMGFTWEHAFHRHLRRLLALDSLLGSATELEREIGEELLVERRLPDLILF